MSNEILFHAASYPWQYVDGDNVLHLTVKALEASIQALTCFACDPCDTDRGPAGEALPRLGCYRMDRCLDAGEEAYFTLSLPLETRKLRYHFQVETAEGLSLLDENGLSPWREELFVRPFFVPYTYPEDHPAVPAWYPGTVWYQIFPDRFAREGAEGPWNVGELSDPNAVYGGTLRGIGAKIPYLKHLGVTGLYLNPVFRASSIHRYDTVDYYAVDPGLGTQEDLVALCDRCHENGIRVMLDGVFNHCSSQFPPFQDVRRRGKDSPYYDWFLIHDPERTSNWNIPRGADGAFRRDPAYEAFAFVPSMPKFNTRNPEVMEHLIGAAEYWTRMCRVDAWRLDVPDEIHPAFLQAFRERMRKLDPKICVIGEFWGDPALWLGRELFDGAMNYPFYFVVRDFAALGAIDAPRCAQLLSRRLVEQPRAKQLGMFNFCSTHDLPRILWHCGEDERRAGLCYLLTAAVGRGFSIYYGDEVGMTGGYDPDDRRCFPWGEETKPHPVGEAIREGISLLRRRGDQEIREISAPDRDVLRITYESFACLLNRSQEEKIVEGTAVPPMGCRLLSL